jgi:succinyl-CoA synthetase beta subunit
MVVRLVGNNEDKAKAIMDKAGITMTNILEKAGEEAVSLAAKA